MTPTLAERDLPPRGVSFGFAETLARFDVALSHIRQWGLRLGNANRWIQYMNRLRTFVESNDSMAPRNELEELAFELREIDEFCDIIEACGPDPTSTEASAIQQILSGTEHPDTEQKSHPRDIQYELWLLAYLRSHGVNVWLHEPDLWFTWKGSDYPIAAKRPQSLAGIKDNIPVANRQLRQRNAWGLMALSIDVIARAPGEMLAAETPKEAAEFTDLVFIDVLESLTAPHSPLSKHMPGTNVGVVLVTLRLPAFSVRCGIASIETRVEFLSLKDDDRSAELGGLREIIGSYS